MGTSIRHSDNQTVLKSIIGGCGRPGDIRSKNDGERVAKDLQYCMRKQGLQITILEPGKPRQNDSNESLNGTCRSECPDAELFGSLMRSKVIIAN